MQAVPDALRACGIRTRLGDALHDCVVQSRSNAPGREAAIWL